MDRSYTLVRFLVGLLLILVGGAAAQVVFVNGFVATPSRGTEVWGYDPAKSTGEDDIRTQFNLHRGRWWNYYARGSWYLAYGHYEAAKRDFEVVVKKRPTDKRNGRTYGMHFRDCFAHRELGITLYHQATEVEAKADRLSLLEDSIEELEQSLRQAESSRAAFFLNLAQESQWEIKKEQDTTAPVITVENATGAGENWATVFCNRRTVQLDIRVTDDRDGSGVRAVWVDEERLFAERFTTTTLRTVHVPVDVDNPWIPIRASDVAGNSSPPTQVRVELDMKPPVIFATSYPEQVTPDGLVPVKYSARDDLGLSTMQLGDRVINCDGRLEHDIITQVKTEGGRGRLEVRATDLAGNTAKGFVDTLPRDRQVREHTEAAGPLANLVPHDRRLAVRPRTQSPPGYPVGDAFRPAVSSAAYGSETVYPASWLRYATVAAEISEPTPMCLPIFVFDERDYKEVTGGYRVPSDQYLVQGRLDYANGVTGIKVGDSEIAVDPNSNSVLFSEFVSLPDYNETKEISVEAVCASGRNVPHTEPLVVRRVKDPTSARHSLYDVVVLPLSQEATPGDPNGEHRTPEATYRLIKEAVMGCKLHDPNAGRFRRFDCNALNALDPNIIRAKLDELELQASSSDHWKVHRLGEAYEVDLGIHGLVRETQDTIEVTLYVVDVASGKCLLSGPIDFFTTKSKPGWRQRLVNGLIHKLKVAIPRVRGQVTEVDRESNTISVDRGKDDRLFRRARLCVFKKDEDGSGLSSSDPVETTVRTLKLHSSKATVVKKKGAADEPILKVGPQELHLFTVISK